MGASELGFLFSDVVKAPGVVFVALSFDRHAHTRPHAPTRDFEPLVSHPPPLSSAPAVRATTTAPRLRRQPVGGRLLFPEEESFLLPYAETRRRASPGGPVRASCRGSDGEQSGRDVLRSLPRTPVRVSARSPPMPRHRFARPVVTESSPQTQAGRDRSGRPFPRRRPLRRRRTHRQLRRRAPGLPDRPGRRYRRPLRPSGAHRRRRKPHRRRRSRPGRGRREPPGGRREPPGRQEIAADLDDRVRERRRRSPRFPRLASFRYTRVY